MLFYITKNNCRNHSAMEKIYFVIVQRGTGAKITCKDYKNNNVGL